MRVRVYQYKNGSKSAKALAETLGVLRIKREGSRFKPKLSDTIINWGSSGDLSGLSPARILNKPDKVARVSDKLKFFTDSKNTTKFKTPPFTTRKEEAENFGTVVCRHILSGSGGRGIEIVERGETLPRAPLYVKYIKKVKEFRIHVAFGEVIDSQRKIRDPDKEPTNWQVRNHDNGFIFARESGMPLNTSKEAAIECIKHFGLDFGAVDLIETKDGETYVLEVNTAPGLEGQTVENYRKVFQDKLGINSTRNIH